MVHLKRLRADGVAAKLLPEPVARRQALAPLWLEADELVVACTDPSDKFRLKQAEAACGRPIHAIRASYPEIRIALDKIYRRESAAAHPLELGVILYMLGYISLENLIKLRTLQKGSRRSAREICLEHGLAGERDLLEALSITCNLPSLELKALEISNALALLLPWEMVTNRKVIPIWWLSGTLVLATPELVPGDQLEDVAAHVGVHVLPVLCTQSDWNRLYRKFYLRGLPDPLGMELVFVRTLQQKDLISQRDLENAHALALQTGHTFADILLGNDIISSNQWLEALSEFTKTPIAPNPTSLSIDMEQRQEIFERLPYSLSERFRILPYRLDQSRLHLAVSFPDEAVAKLIVSLTGWEVVESISTSKEIIHKLKEIAPTGDSRKPSSLPGLNELLLRLGILSAGQVESVKNNSLRTQPPSVEGLLSGGYLDEAGFIEVLGLQTGLPHSRFEHARPLPEFATIIPESVSNDHQIIPIWSNENDLWVVTADPFDAQGLMLAEQATGKRVWPVLAAPSIITATLDRWLTRTRETPIDKRKLDLLQKLVGEGYLTQIGATQALNAHQQKKIPLDQAIAAASARPHPEITQAIARIINLPFVSLKLEESPVKRIDPLGREVERTLIQDPVEEKVATFLRLQDAQKFSALPIRESGNHIIVGFADPFHEIESAQVESQVGRKVIPVLVDREELDDAIQRILGKRNIGTYLLMDGLITRSQLNNALELAEQTGVRLGQALINRGFINEAQLYQYLAKQSRLPLYDLSLIEIDKNLAASIPPGLARENGMLPIQMRGEEVLLATVDPYNTVAKEEIEGLLGKPTALVLVAERDFEAALERLFSEEYLARSTSELLERMPQDSAFRVLSKGQIISLILMAIFSALWLWLDYKSYIILFNALATIFYVGFSVYKFYLVYRALAYNMELPVNPEELRSLTDRELPVYTLLVPVYREAEVLPELLSALSRLDYPTTKLDIQVLMEQDDQATIAAYDKWAPPSQFHRIIVPAGGPKTKPKACNYGLIHSRGEFVVIFDAEDLPEPDQLKKVLAAFAKAPPEVACIQSKLNYYNSGQNILTQWFTVEYSMWFDLFLPGLSATKAPIPLGGTSNHFKKSVLVEIGAWDPYNVTEDADLGVRLFKRGYQTAIIDSTTFEEANSRVYNWIRQRSRWIKGYIQTWLVHMRNPRKLIREIGYKAFFSFHFVVGGTFFAALLNPIYWLLTTLWFLVQWQFIQVIYPGVVYVMGALALFVGNFAFTYMNVAGALRREQYGMVKYALLSPIYWGLASIAAWMGLIQLLYKPHFWEKTMHGLQAAEDLTGQEPVEESSDTDLN